METVTASTYDMKGVSRRAISRSIVPESLDEEYFQNVILNFDDKFFDKESLIDYFNEKNISIFYISPYYNTFIVNVNEKQFKQIQNERRTLFFL